MTLSDLLDLDTEEMEKLGIQTYKLRKKLGRAIMEATRRGATQSAGVSESVPQASTTTSRPREQPDEPDASIPQSSGDTFKP